MCLVCLLVFLFAVYGVLRTERRAVEALLYTESRQRYNPDILVYMLYAVIVFRFMC